jgi:hypothetical protein
VKKEKNYESVFLTLGFHICYTIEPKLYTMRRIRHTRKPERPQKFIKIDPRTALQADNETSDDASPSNYLTKPPSGKPRV